MDSSNIFEEKKKLYENIDNEDISAFEQRIQTKLTLRKQKVNEILHKKRLSDYISVLNRNGSKSKWKLLYDIKKEILGMTKYKFNFKDDEEILKLSLKYLNSDNITDIKYCIILLEIFINKYMNSQLTSHINLLFTYNLFLLIEKFINDKEIIFNILYILICYSNINTDNHLSSLLLSPNSYKLWELCFNLQDYEILYEIIAILNNIISENQIGGCNLIRSNLLLNNLYNFYMNQSIVSQMNNNNRKEAISNIIEDGIILICKLLIIPTNNLDRFTREEIFISKQKIINLVISYSNSNLYKNYYTCIYSIFIIVQNEKRLFEELDKNNFIQNILKNKKFFDIQKIRFFINKIIGNYLAYKNKVKYNLLEDIVNFEKDYLNICNINSNRKEIFWVLSNAIICDKNIKNEILETKGLLENIFFCYKNSCSYSEIKEISYFFRHLLFNSNIKQFIQIENYKLLEIAVEHAKNSLENDAEGLVLIFELIEYYLSFGKITKKYFDGKNYIIEKFNKIGGKELLDKYIDYPNEIVKEMISYILKEYYQK